MKAAHIIGGDLYYECLGYGNNGLDTNTRKYRIVLTLYRDCRPQQSAGTFDDPLGFTIYRKDLVTSKFTLVRNGNRNEFSIVGFSGPTLIDPPNYPCLELPPDICVESGIYEYEVDLPIIDEEYHIIWQRCCRNNTISNILNPGQVGITFTITIHPESQKTCNSSPRFRNFPPTVVCVNNPFQFDHSAIDKEGDLLVYSLCEPFGGGANNGNGCNAVIPNPDCPPPFPKVNFRAPQYNYLFPMGGNPPVTINSLTGMISGEPNVQGQFVVSVCCSEYRNGVLLSTLRRDFQFNVASCVGTVVAKLNNGIEVSKQNYEMLICSSDSIKIDNSSYQQRFINGIVWEYQNGGILESSTDWNPVLKFKEGGIHSGRFILNPGTNCSDTANFRINVIADLKSDFTFSYDSCKLGPVDFSDQSKSSFSKIVSWNWDFGDGFKGFDKNYQLQYLNPDNYAVKLDVYDEFGCKSTVTKNLGWFPAPNVIIFKPSATEGCVPFTINFKNISFPTDSNYKFKWIFSDSTEYSGINVTKTFDSTGIYGLKLEVTSPIGCYNSGSFDKVIHVLPPPAAKWSVDPLVVNILNASVIGIDSSTNTIGRSWIVDGKEFFFDQELNYRFKDTGYHNIRLIVNDRFLCTDTLDTQVFVFKNYSLYMPNAFTPNGDGNNEVFGPVGQFDGLNYYELNIYDRWGSLLFSSTKPEEMWNGKVMDSDKLVPSGTYVYILKYKLDRKDPVELRNVFALIR
ncbi:MAG: gliding motility-associated C-terminal domain-containing protein [Saprospiraceae bacterium]|nr:gliding motility-associated C-terminal domain-containing protein [Saprospiraceae bacterium]